MWPWPCYETSQKSHAIGALQEMPLVARMTIAEFMEWSAATP